MPDTSKMSPEECKAFVDDKATGKKSGSVPSVPIEFPPMMPRRPMPPILVAQEGLFTPGQMVWRKDGGPYKVVFDDGHEVWVKNDGDVSVLFLRRDLFATNPNDDPVSQNCPFCGDNPHAQDYVDGDWHVRCNQNSNGCGCKGPYRPTRLQAIEAWNSIRVSESTSYTDLLSASMKADSAYAEHLRKSKPQS